MKHLSRIIWSEGMHLGPHHFQAQATYFENAVHFMASALWREPYGLLGYELDGEALRNGTVALVHARGIFPDGLAFHMPESDQAPEPRNIAELFPPTRDRMRILLAVPRRKPGGANTALDGGAADSLRYVAEEKILADDNTGIDEKPVSMGRKNIRLLLDVEPAENMVTLPLARAMRDGAGGFIYDEAFIPPCLTIGASERLMSLSRRMVELLQEKGASLAAVAHAGGRLQAGLSAQQVATFWFLHSVNSALAPLRHITFSKQGHPEELFLELLRLGGALCTFGLDSHPRTLPLYDHMGLEECFGALDEHIRTHLEIMLPTQCVSIPLHPAGKDYYFDGSVTDTRCLGRARWIFGIQSSMGEAELIRQAPRLVKICSSAFVPELVRRALPGMVLTHLSSPPGAVSPRVDLQYFMIDRAGPCWEHILQTRSVGVYIPSDIPEAKPELLVVLES